jgi:hypothetical protein
MEACAIDLSGKKVITIRERRERFWIAKLERLPCFELMVKRLVDGKSVSSVARWARSLGMDCELKDTGFETWRKYINALSIRIRLSMEARPEIKPKAVRAIIEDVKANADAYDVPLSENGRKLWRLVEKAVKELDSEKMLKYVFVIQQRRVGKILVLEEKTGLLFPDGHKNVAVLMNIAAEVLKHELGQLAMRGKNPPTYKELSDAVFPQQESQSMPTPKWISDIAKIDRDKWRAAGARVIEHLRQDADPQPKIDV